MRSARDDILAALRRQTGRDATQLAVASEKVERMIAQPHCGPRPQEPEDVVALFIERARAMISTVDLCADLAQVPVRCAQWLRQHELPLDPVVVPSLADLDWHGAGLDARIGAAGGGDRVGVTGCFRAIAETGTLMLCSGPDSPAVNSLLPETHVAVVPRAHIVADMEEAWRAARSELAAWPRAINFVSGPSRTADIEQTIVLGAHGPYRVHLLIVG